MMHHAPNYASDELQVLKLRPASNAQVNPKPSCRRQTPRRYNKRTTVQLRNKNIPMLRTPHKIHTYPEKKQHYHTQPAPYHTNNDSEETESDEEGDLEEDGPYVGYGFSDDASVISEMSTPTVVGSFRVPEEEDQENDDLNELMRSLVPEISGFECDLLPFVWHSPHDVLGNGQSCFLPAREEGEMQRDYIWVPKKWNQPAGYYHWSTRQANIEIYARLQQVCPGLPNLEQ